MFYFFFPSDSDVIQRLVVLLKESADKLNEKVSYIRGPLKDIVCRMSSLHKMYINNFIFSSFSSLFAPYLSFPTFNHFDSDYEGPRTFRVTPELFLLHCV